MPRADSYAANPHWLPPLPDAATDHVPGTDGWPIIGDTFKLLADPPKYLNDMVETYGPIHRRRAFGDRFVMLVGAEANELVLFDRDKVFSSEQGWGPMLNQIFPRGLMLLDGEKHRADRKILSVAFKPEPMRLYTDALNAGIRARISTWAGKPIKFYREVKALTLELAASSFFGMPLGPVADAINRAFVNMVQASVAPIRTPLPGTTMGRGVAGRKFLIDHLSREIPARRATGGDDMFSQICCTRGDDGAYLADDAIIDHMNFLMMAAHDTITSSSTSLLMHLGQNPEWQDRLRAEMIGLGVNGDDLPYDRLGDLTLTEYVFKESLRLMPPVPSLPRRAIKPFTFQGIDFAAGTHVGISPDYVHMMPEHWPDPERFDPMRHTPEASRNRHKYAWVPFGGGAHMCLGLHFAYMQIKLILWHMLRTHQIALAPSAGSKWQAWPIPKPIDALPLTIQPL
jgi:cytochrome P450